MSKVCYKWHKIWFAGLCQCDPGPQARFVTPSPPSGRAGFQTWLSGLCHTDTALQTIFCPINTMSLFTKEHDNPSLFSPIRNKQ